MCANSGSRIRTVIAQGRRTQIVPSSAIGKAMTLEWFHAVLGAIFIGVWIIVGQIVAADRSDLKL